MNREGFTCVRCNHSFAAHRSGVQAIPCNALNITVQPNVPCTCTEFERPEGRVSILQTRHSVEVTVYAGADDSKGVVVEFPLHPDLYDLIRAGKLERPHAHQMLALTADALDQLFDMLGIPRRWARETLN